LATDTRGGDRKSTQINRPNERLIERPMSTPEMRVSERSVRRAKARQAGKPPKPAYKQLAKDKPGPMAKPLPSPYMAKVRDLVMAHLDQLPVEFVDGLCALDPKLGELVAAFDAAAREANANGAEHHAPAPEEKCALCPANASPDPSH
jgi:hypothetical protein